MRQIKLPEPPGSSPGMPEIFDRGISSVVRRALIIGNGAAGAEHQCVGLLRSLGFGNNYEIHRVYRPRGGYNLWLRWLPVQVHKKLDCLLKHLQADWRHLPFSFLISKKEDGSQIAEDIAAPNPTKIATEADATRIATMAKDEFDRGGPLLVVASGRDTVSVAAEVKRLAPKTTYVIQIQHPRCRLDQFDMVITPSHDYYALTPAARQEVPQMLLPLLTPRQPPEKHVVLTIGALHHADAAMLRGAAATWHDELVPLPKPLLIVNIGGPARHCRYGEDLAVELVTALKRVLVTCGSVRISFSKRTTLAIATFVQRELGHHPKVYIWDGRGVNPHLGHLAWGDAFVVTADSISMLSEACSTGKPVYVVGAERCTWKFAEFQRNLRQRGVIRSLTGAEDMRESWSYPPLDDNREAANQVRQRLAAKGWSLP